MHKWKLCVIALMCLVFLAGLGILLYPYIHGAVVDKEISDKAQSFLNRQETKPAETDPAEGDPSGQGADLPEKTESRPYQELWNAMTECNAEIFRNEQADLTGPWAYEKPSFDLSEYGIEDEVFGVISIPTMDLRMPIYLGATYDHMAMGTAHLSQTSQPIGGMNTNCVIVGHRGWGGAPYFRYIDKLQIGDTVTVTNLWETLTYEVVEIKIVQPDDIKAVLIQPGRELLTLLTCHPYASGGRQRYLVFCERVYGTS